MKKGKESESEDEAEVDEVIEETKKKQVANNLVDFVNFDYKKAQMGDVLHSDDLALMRNSKNGYKELERLFGTLGSGCSFGESCLFGSDST